MMVVFEIWGPSQHGFIEITAAFSGRLKSSDWSADSAAKLLWSLARYGKGEEILKHRQVAPRGRGSRGSRFRGVLGFTLILGKSGKK
jgi:hypothetical protein